MGSNKDSVKKKKQQQTKKCRNRLGFKFFGTGNIISSHCASISHLRMGTVIPILNDSGRFGEKEDETHLVQCLIKPINTQKHSTAQTTGGKIYFTNKTGFLGSKSQFSLFKDVFGTQKW